MQIRTLFPLTAALLGAALSAACTHGDPLPPHSGSGGSTSSGGGEGGTSGEGGGVINTGGAGGVGGTGGAGGAGGGGGSTGTDTCPGEAVSLGLNENISLPGSTAGLAGDYDSYCGTGTGSGADVVYAITATESGTLSLSLGSANGLNGVLYAQETCGDVSFYCKDEGDGVESFSFDAEAGMVYYVVVDGRDQTEGDYVLSATLAPGACGDGVINAPAEDCDFGDTDPGDGCDASCQFEPPSDLSDACPGQVQQVTAGNPLVITSYTTGYTDNYTSCGAMPGSPDRVFAIFPATSGNLTVTLPNLGAAGGGFDPVLAAWAATCDPSNTTMPPYLGCSDGANASDTETMTFAVTAGTLYFVVVDGYANYSFGNFELTVALN